MAAGLGQVDSELLDTSIVISSCERGDLSELQRVLEASQFDIGSEPLDSEGQTALHIACVNGHLHIAQYLVNEKECSVMVEDVYRHNPFVLSLIYKHWKVAEFLLTVSPNSDSFKKHIGLLHYGESLVAKVANEALVNSCANGYFHLVKFVIEYKKDYNYTDLKYMRTSARSNGQLHIVQLLLKYCEPARDMTLSEACIVGDVEKVTAALASHGAAVLSKTDWYRMSPLHYASCEPKILRMTMSVITKENKALFNSKDTFGNTPLHYAVLAGCTESVNLLLRAPECDINLVNTKGETPLHFACRQSGIMILVMLATEEMCDLNVQNINGDTALHIALKERMAVKYIKELTFHKSCNPSIVNHGGMTPLQLAFNTDQVSAVKILLQCAKCSHENIAKAIQDLLHHALHVDRMPLFNMFIEMKEFNINEVNHDHQTALHVACTKRNMKYFQALIQQPTCDLSIQDDNGDTTLHIAACSKWNSAEKMQCLLECDRCDPNITNKQGYTPLHTATEHNQVDSLIKLLNSTKCNPNIQDLHGNTALHLSIRQKSATVIEHFLMCIKVNVNIQNRQGDTPLHVAVDQGIPISVIEALTHHVHCNVSIANNEGMTPLQLLVKMERLLVANVIAKKSSREDIKKMANEDRSDVLYKAMSENCLFLVQALLEFQSEKVNLRYNSSETPLHAACRLGHCDMIEILLENGADIQAVDSSGDAPIHIACNGLGLDCLKPILQSKGCDPNQKNAYGDTALHIVLNIGTVHFCKFEILLENGADVQAVDSNGDAPIHIVCNGLRLDCLKALLQSKGCDPNQKNAYGDTALHIVCRVGEYMDSFIQALISTPGIDPEVANHAGLTPAEVAGEKYFVINNFLKQKQSSLQTYLKIFVVGNSGTGKSTLIKAVTTEASQLLKYAIFPKMKFVNPSDVPPHTAGIVPISFKSKHFGHAVLYDFAGQHEYYSSHAAVMENLILPTPPLFLLLIDISKPIEKIKEELVYWWQFINNLSQRAAAPPHVMFVASHKDKVRARGEDPQSIIDTVLKFSIRDIQVSFKFEGSFPMDCRKLVSQGLTALLAQLNTTCQVLKQTANIDLHCHILKAFLTTTELRKLIYCQIVQVLEKIKSDDALLPQSSSQLIPLLSTLSDQGHILLLQNYTDVKKSWVILKPEVLLAEVNGSIFAPDYFKEHFRNFAMSTGVVTLSKIREKFTEFHHEVLVEFLVHLEFCFRLKDKHTLELITKNEVSLTNEASDYREEYYFFPSLVRNENPEDVCQPQETDMYQCGWFYKCGKETEQLTTRFLHVLILRLTFSCEPPDDPTERESVVLLRSGSVWKHGIAWWTNDGIETIVEVGLQCRWVAVMMRCPDTHKVQCAELRSKVIAIVLKAKQDFCPAIIMNEFLIAPSSLQYPFEGRELALYSMRNIASIVIEGKDFARDIEGKNLLKTTKLLPFEPYFNMGNIINELFTTNQSLIHSQLAHDDIVRIAERCYKSLEYFREALKPRQRAYEEECSRTGDSQVSRCIALFQVLQRRGCKTWRDFEREFSRFSIFCGRNPMVTTTTLCS